MLSGAPRPRPPGTHRQARRLPACWLPLTLEWPRARDHRRRTGDAHRAALVRTKAGDEDNQTVTLYQRAGTAPDLHGRRHRHDEAHGGLPDQPRNVDDRHAVPRRGRRRPEPAPVVRVVCRRSSSRARPKACCSRSSPRPAPPSGACQVHRHGEPGRDSGALVVLQRQNALKGNEWHRIGSPASSAKEGPSRSNTTSSSPAPPNIRVVVRDPKVNVPSPSNALNYEITQAQNPRLTIESLSRPDLLRAVHDDPRSVEKLAPGTPLKLLAHEPARCPASRLWAKAKVESGGKYTFASADAAGAAPSTRCRAATNPRRCSTRASNTC